MKRTTCLLLAACLLSTFADPQVGGRTRKRTAKLQSRVYIQQVVACLAAQEWIQEDLKAIGFEDKKTLTIRYKVGSIPGTSPRNSNVWNVAVFGRKGNDGWLFFVRREGSEFIALRNAYKLSRDGKVWSAGEGNGGIATYEAVSRYVSRMSKQSSNTVTVRPAPEGCRAE